jgi:hypothetical protein
LAASRSDRDRFRRRYAFFHSLLEGDEKRFGHVILISQPREKNLGSCKTKQLQGSFVVRQ